jgi:hypothetical protein
MLITIIPLSRADVQRIHGGNPSPERARRLQLPKCQNKGLTSLTREMSNVL